MLKANTEALKEVARLVLLYAVSWVITETMRQINMIPESYTLKIWVLAYDLPVRVAINLALTTAGRYVDKYLFEKRKEEDKSIDEEYKRKSGLLPF